MGTGTNETQIICELHHLKRKLNHAKVVGEQ